MMRDYSEDELDAEQRALGIYTSNTPLHEQNIMIVNYYDTLRRGGQPLPTIKPPSISVGSLKQPSDAIIHDFSILSGLPPSECKSYVWLDCKRFENRATQQRSVYKV
ncbi:MAG: hypothetical protein ACKPKO_21745 [Candidatus Fonsibacter sp.]